MKNWFQDKNILRDATLTVCFVLFVPTIFAGAIEPTELDKAIQRSIHYLAVEVPQWQKENDCASCHNQGDASRALIEAHRQKLFNGQSSLQTSIDWIGQPGHWELNRGLPEANDPTLSNLQFASTLLAAHKVLRPMPDAVKQAAEILAPLQQNDGAWIIAGGSQFGSPLTHGPILLTGQATSILKAAESPKFVAQARRAEQWLREQSPRNTIEASSLLLISSELGWVHPQASRCLQIIFQSQSDAGGVGPYAIAQDENFDTALAVLAVDKSPRNPANTKFQDNAVKYLLSMQGEDGSWSETTRPSGTESYAHRISTTGWALQALLAHRAN